VSNITCIKLNTNDDDLYWSNNASPHVKLRLPKEVVDYYKKIGEHLKYNGRFSLPEELEEIVSDFIRHRIEVGKTLIPSGAIYYRARLFELGQDTVFPKYDMGAPPKGVVEAGRINPEGISYLYLADTPETAIAEVRPWKGAQVAVGKFRVTRDLDVVNLFGEKRTFSISKGMVDFKSSIASSIKNYFISSMYFSAPAHNKDKLAYLPSQYISEMFKNNGFAGLEYNSVMHEEGRNIVIFDVALATCIDVVSYKINSIHYSSTIDS
jgi:hypothetical protein